MWARHWGWPATPAKLWTRRWYACTASKTAIWAMELARTGRWALARTRYFWWWLGNCNCFPFQRPAWIAGNRIHGGLLRGLLKTWRSCPSSVDCIRRRWAMIAHVGIDCTCWIWLTWMKIAAIVWDRSLSSYILHVLRYSFAYYPQSNKWSEV